MKDNTLLQNLPTIIGIATIILIALIVFIVIFAKSKKLKIDNVYFISGGVKTGKTYLSVVLVLYRYLINVIAFYIRKFLIKELVYFTFHRSDKINSIYHDLMKPMLYSNMKIKYVRFNKFTIDILRRNVRIPNKSCLLIDEASLIADSMLYQDKDINSDLLCFYKLWGHYSHGGTMIVNSQSISDNHYSLKRCMSRYLYIYSRYKVPFFTICRVREMVYSDDNSQINITSGDLEDSNLKMLILPNFLYKFYDCYCYSVFTDSLAYQVDYNVKKLGKRDSLKVDTLVTLQDFKNLDKRSLNNEAQ